MVIEKFYNLENRKLEFKETLPSGDKIVRTAVAFSNDAGGEIYIGIKNEPREIVGVPEDELFKLEEQISSIIYENCNPTILADIISQKIDDKYILRVKIPRGSLTPYYIKSLGKEKGTFIRVGSTNRLADREIIEELERRRRNISYDSTSFYEFKTEELKLDSFKKLYEEKTGKKIAKTSLSKLGLIKTENEKDYPTIAAVLLSEKEIKQQYFPYAKIECARFKGIKTDTTLDSLTIEESICLQADQAIAFVQRNIKKGSKIGEVYREERWEYPLLAVRELIINAIIHRDYSLQGKDIKVAIFDDMLEITSPGVIPATIDLTNLTSGQSEIKNRTLAPIFKELKLIEQWGTGFKKLSDELQEYPEIELKFNEPGLGFQVQFIKKDYTAPSEVQVGTKSALSWHQVSTKLALSREEVEKVLLSTKNPISIADLMYIFGRKDRSKFRDKYINPSLELEIIQMTIPDKPNSSKQKYIITDKGKGLFNELENTQQVPGKNPESRKKDENDSGETK